MKNTSINYNSLEKLKALLPDYMKIVDLYVHNSWLCAIVVGSGNGVTFRVKN